MRSSFYNEKVIDALAERPVVDQTCRVVDVGTGTGSVAAGLASRAGAARLVAYGYDSLGMQ
jgi:methylase of polypeptide subunit release factors